MIIFLSSENFISLILGRISQRQTNGVKNRKKTTMQAVSLCHKRPIACWGSAPIPSNDACSIELNLKNFILYELDILTNVLLPVWRGLLFTTVSFL